MTTTHESTLARLRALVLTAVWLVTAGVGATSGAAHAAVTGTVMAWGDNSHGHTDAPAGLSGVSAIAGGYRFTAALKNDGTVVAWGDDSYSKTTVPDGLSGVRAIATGADHTVALKSDGTVVAWGSNRYGQRAIPAGLGGVRAIAAGALHTVALKTDGTVVAWGDDRDGQSNVPAGLSGIAAIAAGGAHTVALKGNGTVVAWGDNSYGQTNVPAGLRDIAAIATGGRHTVALKGNGTVVAWGYNGEGQTTIPAGLRDIMVITAGSYHTVALRSSYRFGGLVAPVNAPPIVNTLKASAGVPVEFSLGGNQGLAIFAQGYPVSRTVSCLPDARTDEVERTVTAHHSSLRYDAHTDSYIYVWRTASSWGGPVLQADPAFCRWHRALRRLPLQVGRIGRALRVKWS